jgi:hypothetical protein
MSEQKKTLREERAHEAEGEIIKSKMTIYALLGGLFFLGGLTLAIMLYTKKVTPNAFLWVFSVISIAAGMFFGSLAQNWGYKMETWKIKSVDFEGIGKKGKKAAEIAEKEKNLTKASVNTFARRDLSKEWGIRPRDEND